ncbi:RagB/SusD family nutrient uptake outer membrane protein [Tamlana sp. 2201CG12-4]|uniref:RagB/SusD family nutrient uptake outer membrane protein n=1 Tax=Tamlana sp. 2201CG12-4 TaxID=3112582 RepID=UPI002DBF9ABF|nr:RagB/SusD family nutrient uptake outer membrane protein [Tamlana sp. 2201CG12-4]MEC3908815.1 RagB/SusD family nutrient uptake outer membrane protein [Tamlana sp. 2201CG12-4]
MKSVLKLLILLGVLNSCQNDFLDEDLDVIITPENFYKTEKEAEVGIFGLYHQLSRKDLYGWYLSMSVDMGTDIAFYGGKFGDTFDIFSNYKNISSSIGNLPRTWNEAYQTIHAANLIIENLPKNATFSQVKQDRFLAEARFVRAVSYLVLSRLYGEVPLVKGVLTLDELGIPRADLAELYQFMIEDLNFAKEHIPWLSELQQGGRASKNAVLGVLTRVYLTMAGAPLNDASKWALAASTSKELIDTDYHDLHENYNQVFLNARDDVYDFTESIWEIEYTKGEPDFGSRIGTFNGIKSFKGPNGEKASDVGGGSGLVRATANIRKIYGEDGVGYNPDIVDSRYHWNCPAYRFDGTQVPRMNPDGTVKTSLRDFIVSSYRKEISNGIYTPNQTGVNAIALRYADVLLMYAEAENEVNGAGRNALANESLAKIRRRAFKTYEVKWALEGAVTNEDDGFNFDYSGLSQEDFRNLIRDERARELPGEGLRRWDLLRWRLLYGNVSDLIGEEPEGEAWGNIQPHNVLYPIPQREIDLNPLLTQNPGY